MPGASTARWGRTDTQERGTTRDFSAGEDEADFAEAQLSYDRELERARWAQIMGGEESVRGHGKRSHGR
jgi:hypothetical protein